MFGLGLGLGPNMGLAGVMAGEGAIGGVERVKGGCGGVVEGVGGRRGPAYPLWNKHWRSVAVEW